MSSDPKAGNVLIKNIEVLVRDRYAVEKYTFDLRARDGSWRPLSREVHWRGDSAAVLLFCRARATVILTRQFRLPVFVREPSSGMIIEAAGGLLEEETPVECVLREAEEETGFRVAKAEKVCVAYMSPALVTERVHFFLAEYDPANRVSDGGGQPAEGEDVEVMEIPMDNAIAMIEEGAIVDGKTILLLLYLKLRMCTGNSGHSANNSKEKP